MRSVKLAALAALLSCFTACKKDYKQTHVCECRNPGGVFASYELKDTRENARKTCDEYNARLDSIPMSESYCILK